MTPLICFLFFFLVFFYADCSQLPPNYPKLLDSSTPAYHGTIDPCPLDIDYFSSRHPFLLNSRCTSNKFDIICEDLGLEIFSYLLNDNFFLFPKLIFSCKRMYRLFGKLVMSRFAKFNPQLFWSLPPQFRLRFALKFLYGFEELYSDGIKTDFILNRDEICGMIFMLLHLRNEYYISPIDLKLMESIKTGKHFMKNRIFKMLFNYPYSSP